MNLKLCIKTPNRTKNNSPNLLRQYLGTVGEISERTGINIFRMFMNLYNKSKNHHFISVCEQKFNSIDSTKRRDKRKIFSFDVIDKNLLITDEPKLVITEKNLMEEHLYTLKESEYRMNFENLFKRYEDLYDSLVNRIIYKIVNKANLSQEILYLFHFKIMNLSRNPYLIHLFNRQFQLLDSVTPKNSEINLLLNEILGNFENPDIRLLCDKYNVGITDYKKWLRKQFILLFDLGSNDFLLDRFCQSLIEDTNYMIHVDIYMFTDEVCLLSDKGYSVTNRINNSDMLFSFDFNVSSHCFIRYQFTHLSILINCDTNKTQLNLLKESAQFQNIRLKYQVFDRNTKDDLKELKAYNRAVISSCDSKVFQSKDKIYI